MQKRTLLPTQTKDVRTIIQEFGFDDSAFQMEERDSKASANMRVNVLVHKATQFYFYFDGGAASRWWAYYSPGNEITEEKGIAGSWNQELIFFKKWLNNLKTQAEESDSWINASHENEASTSTTRIPFTSQTTKSSVANSSSGQRRIFIGHGRSNVWKDLRDLLHDRLGLAWDEFNREPQAGKSTKERLEEMLDQSCFAFLIMTAEDEHADQTLHARENVIHEVGLFQGRLSFSKAIVLFEDGCKEFSNIQGLTQIRFPKDKIMAISEEIRRVLEREGILGD